MHRVASPHLAWAVGSHASAGSWRCDIRRPRRLARGDGARDAPCCAHAVALHHNPKGGYDVPLGLTFAEYVSLTEPQAQWLAGVLAVAVSAALAALRGPPGPGDGGAVKF